MSFKPSDFYVTVLAFFSIVLPGAVLTFLFKNAIASYSDVLRLPKLQGNQNWLAFFVVAYFVGQALYALGSWILDALYSRTYVFYKRWKKSVEGDKLLKPLIVARMQSLGLKDVTGAYAWARAYVNSTSTSAGASIERLDADSKLFRSMTIILAVAPYLFLTGNEFPWQTVAAFLLGLILGAIAYAYSLRLEPQSRGAASTDAGSLSCQTVSPRNVKKGSWRGHHLFKWLGVLPISLIIAAFAGALTIVYWRSSWLGVALYLAIAIGSFVRFANQRWERDDTAYEFILTLPK